MFLRAPNEAKTSGRQGLRKQIPVSHRQTRNINRLMSDVGEAVVVVTVADEEVDMAVVQIKVDRKVVVPPGVWTKAMLREIFLNEENITTKLLTMRTYGSSSNLWYVDNGASSHMTGQRSKFYELDTSIRGHVKFGDDSVVFIEGKGTVHLQCKNGEKRVLHDTKDEAFDYFKKFRALAENESGGTLLTFRTDRGGESMSKKFEAYCQETRNRVFGAE
ncbi:hypothetical protein L2E82_36535 [Cichorium intybus]|uniref:Uncharacterized protein n=1 Tax=Cichorium intybus TaxID=13427 RepID=A0ACB9BRW9_CICIN|nr:hypothetical protein L2E82_36535 [Cichorium intybus]